MKRTKQFNADRWTIDSCVTIRTDGDSINNQGTATWQGDPGSCSVDLFLNNGEFSFAHFEYHTSDEKVKMWVMERGLPDHAANHLETIFRETIETGTVI